MGVCAECGQEIDFVNFACDQRQYGRARLYGSRSLSHEFRDTGDTENYSYECPECDASFSWEEAIDMLNREVEDDDSADDTMEMAGDPPAPTGWTTQAPRAVDNAVNDKGISITS